MTMSMAWLPDSEGDKIIVTDITQKQRKKIRKFLLEDCKIQDYCVENTKTGLRVQIIADRVKNGGWPVPMPSTDFIRGYIYAVCS